MLRSDRRHAQVFIFINNALLKWLDAQVFTQGLAVGRRRQPGAQGRLSGSKISGSAALKYQFTRSTNESSPSV